MKQIKDLKKDDILYDYRLDCPEGISKSIVESISTSGGRCDISIRDKFGDAYRFQTHEFYEDYFICTLESETEQILYATSLDALYNEFYALQEGKVGEVIARTDEALIIFKECMNKLK